MDSSPAPGAHRSTTWSSRVLPRVLLGLLVVSLLAVASLTVAAVLRGRGSSGGERPPDHAPRAVPEVLPVAAASTVAPSRPLRVLHRWDLRRSRAWARGDPAALRSLYTPRSAAGHRDVVMLRAWTTRGVRVRGLRVQVLAVRVLDRSRDRLRLRVTDRVSAGRAGSSEQGWRPLPADAATTRSVTLVRTGGRAERSWRVAAVREAGPDDQPDPPVAQPAR